MDRRKERGGEDRGERNQEYATANVSLEESNGRRRKARDGTPIIRNQALFRSIRCDY